jgi:hypothetical protein
MRGKVFLFSEGAPPLHLVRYRNQPNTKTSAEGTPFHAILGVGVQADILSARGRTNRRLLFEAAQSEANAAELSAKAVAPFERPRLAAVFVTSCLLGFDKGAIV